MEKEEIGYVHISIKEYDKLKEIARGVLDDDFIVVHEISNMMPSYSNVNPYSIHEYISVNKSKIEARIAKANKDIKARYDNKYKFTQRLLEDLKDTKCLLKSLEKMSSSEFKKWKKQQKVSN